MPDPKRIAVLRYRFIGDSLLTVPFLRGLRKCYPDAAIDWFIGTDADSLFATCPLVDRVIAYEPRRLGIATSVQMLREGKYDRVYLLKRSFSSALYAWLARIPERIGFDTGHRRFLMTEGVPYTPKERHEAECFLDVLPADAPPQDMTPGFWLAQDLTDNDLVTWLPEHAGPRIVLHATSTNRSKCWPVAHFVQLAEALVKEHDALIYALGTPGDSAVYKAMIRRMSPETQGAVLNLCGQTTIAESAALLRHMQLVVANDSGLIHLAAAAGTPLVALFGPTDPLQWEPLGNNHMVLAVEGLTCRPCRMKISCGHTYPCLVELTPERVLDACKHYLTS